MKKMLMVLGVVLALGSVSWAAPDIAHLQKVLGKTKVNSVTATEVKGVYELSIEGIPVPLYISEDGKYLIEGQITDLVTMKNLTEAKRNLARAELIASIPEKDMIIYKRPGAQHTITIFTDVDCGYCRKLHTDLEKYLEAGINIRYLAFPAIAKKEKMESVWCSEHPQTVLTEAKQNKSIKSVRCGQNNPVQKQYEAGLAAGITGTPSIILEDGSLIGGYMPVEELVKILNP